MGPGDFDLSIGHRFSDPELLRRALTHRSYGASHNERLEYLGDSVVNCVVALELYHKFPGLPEGELSRLRANLVNQQSLAAIAQQFDLGAPLAAGRGRAEERRGAAPVHPRRRGGSGDRRRFPRRRLRGGAGRSCASCSERRSTPSIPRSRARTPRRCCRNTCRGASFALPQYSVVATRGEAHEQQFQVECVIPELGIRSLGEGASRRSAEQEAARQAYELATRA